MGFRKTFLLLLTLIVLGGYYYLFEMKFREEKEKGGKATKAEELRKVFPFAEKDFIDIRIVRDKEEIHYQRNSEGWQMVRPLLIQGDGSSLEGLLESLKDLSEVESVIDRPSNVSEFGLDKPSLTIEVKTKGSVLPKTLFLGNDTPTRITIYAKTSDSSRVFMVGSLIRWEVNKEFDNLKNRIGPFFKGGK
jgi:hypothetical protein